MTTPKWTVYHIDYEHGRTEFWSLRPPTEVYDAVWWTREGRGEGKRPVAIRDFLNCAGACFGIRKSIGQITLLGTSREFDLPSFLTGDDSLPGVTMYLTHNGDRIAFDDRFECDGFPWKLFSEHGEWCSCPERGVPSLTCDVHHFWVPDHNKLCKCHLYQCRAITKAGKRCERRTNSWHDWGSDYCPTHRSREAA